MPVSYMLPAVIAQLDKWNLVRDCLSGQSAIKGQGTKYLPQPNADDKSSENAARYQSYLARAVFYNVTKRTLDGLVGQVFSREPIVKLDPKMEMLLSDADGAGVSLAQQAKKTLSSVMGYGRCGLLVDYPPTNGPSSKDDLEKGYVRPTISFYEPWEIINWRTIVVGAKEMLALIVLSEPFISDDDGFEVKTDIQYRVLRLNYRRLPNEAVDPQSLFYTIEIWRNATATSADPIPHQVYQPTDADGKLLTEIPFTFVGALNNDSSIDQPPMYDMATLNIAHYRNSADYEESCFITGQPTPYFAGLTQHWVDEVLKGGVRLGARSAVPLPEGGTAGLLQPNPNTLPFEAMQHKEKQMVALGAKLIEQKNVQRTLGETKIEETSESSILSTVTHNVNHAYETALEWCATFLGVKVVEGEGVGDIEYKLNTDFPAAKMTPDDRAQLVAEWQTSAISFSEMRAALRRAGVATLGDTEVQAEIAANPPPKPEVAPSGGNANGRASPKQSGKTQQ